MEISNFKFIFEFKKLKNSEDLSPKLISVLAPAAKILSLAKFRQWNDRKS